MSRKVCVVTGTRAEFGSTYLDIERAGFFIDRKVEMLLGADAEKAISKSIGLGMIGFADAYDQLCPGRDIEKIFL